MSAKITLICIAVVLFLTAAGCGAGGSSAPTPTPVLDGQVLLQTRCTECHTLRRVERAALTLDDWRRVIDSMIVEGAVLQPAETDALSQYLAVQYPAN